MKLQNKAKQARMSKMEESKREPVEEKVLLLKLVSLSEEIVDF